MSKKKIEDVKRIFPLLSEGDKEEALRYLEANDSLEKPESYSSLAFAAKSVPGIGRQLRIPMYLQTFDIAYYQNNIITDGGSGQPSGGNPTVIVNLDAPGTRPILAQNIATYSEDTTFGHYIIKGLTFATRQTPWARMRVLSIETDLHYTPNMPVRPDSADHGENVSLGIGLGAPPRILLKNYRVSGSANLFLQNSYIDGTFFDADRKMFGGLRAYPLLDSPKVLKVDVALSGEHYHGSTGALGKTLTFTPGGSPSIPSNTQYSFSVSAVVEVLDDTSFGAHIPGPYARGASIKRTVPARGQAFIPEGE